eukprot:7071379-Prymnesium_polylepis.1
MVTKLTINEPFMQNLSRTYVTKRAVHAELQQPAVRFTQINNAVLIILSHIVPEHAGFDDSTSGCVTVASAADHLHEND